jgi:hypothetical protein
MPWVKIGRYRFDLDDVALVVDVVGEDVHEDRRQKGGVTVTLQTQLAFDLLGADAEVFTRAFDEHVAARSIERAPPRVVESLVVRPGPASVAHPEKSNARNQ